VPLLIEGDPDCGRAPDVTSLHWRCGIVNPATGAVCTAARMMTMSKQGSGGRAGCRPVQQGRRLDWRYRVAPWLLTTTPGLGCRHDIESADPSRPTFGAALPAPARRTIPGCPGLQAIVELATALPVDVNRSVLLRATPHAMWSRSAFEPALPVLRGTLRRSGEGPRRCVLPTPRPAWWVPLR